MHESSMHIFLMLLRHLSCGNVDRCSIFEDDIKFEVCLRCCKWTILRNYIYKEIKKTKL